MVPILVIFIDEQDFPSLLIEENIYNINDMEKNK